MRPEKGLHIFRTSPGAIWTATLAMSHLPIYAMDLGEIKEVLDLEARVTGVMVMELVETAEMAAINLNQCF